MNAFALHDVSDQAVCAALGRIGRGNPRRACRADRDRHELVPAAAGARRHPACDHGRHGAGFRRAATDAAGASRRDQLMQQADASPPEPASCGSGRRADRADPAAGEAGSRGAAGAEGGNEAGDRARQAGPGGKADAGQAESRSPGREEADRRAACAAHRRRRPAPSARRRPRPPPTPAHRPRRSPPTGSWSAPICSASSSTRRPPSPRPAGHSRGQLSRSAAAGRCSSAGLADRRASRRWMPRPWRWCAGPAVSRIPAGSDAGLDAVQRAGGVHHPQIARSPIPSPRPSATTRSNPRTANKTARPAASRAASPPSARPTGRRRR